MTGVDFDFAKYVSMRQGAMEQRARDGAAYSFSGEQKARRLLATARPVTIAIEATSRRWRGAAKDKLLEQATLVTDQSYPAVRTAARKAGDRLGLRSPPIYVVAETSGISAQAFGTDSDPLLAIGEGLAENLPEGELAALIGHLLGHVQNNHVVFSTALFYLRHEAFFFVRWIVSPAIMTLQAWRRRADISCDRAALIACQDLDTALSLVVKTGTGSLDVDVSATLAEFEEGQSGSSMSSLFRSHPETHVRVAALRAFAETTLYKRTVDPSSSGGTATEDVDALVSELL